MKLDHITAVLSAVYTGADTPQQIAARTGLGLLTVQEVLRHAEARGEVRRRPTPVRGQVVWGVT